MIAQGSSGMTKTNYIFIAAIGLLIFLRSTLYTVDFSTIQIIITYEKTQGDTIAQPSFWIVFRGIIAPIVNITELCMISYLVYHQDKRNRIEQSKVKKGPNKTRGNKDEMKKEEFFMHVEMQENEKLKEFRSTENNQVFCKSIVHCISDDERMPITR